MFGSCLVHLWLCLVHVWSMFGLCFVYVLSCLVMLGRGLVMSGQGAEFDFAVPFDFLRGKWVRAIYAKIHLQVSETLGSPAQVDTAPRLGQTSGNVCKTAVCGFRKRSSKYLIKPAGFR